MVSHVSFAVRIGLRSSVIISHTLSLDALLSAVIFKRTQDVEVAHSTIPLSYHVGGVWCGSAALIEGPAPIREVSVIQSLRANLDVSPAIVSPGKKGYPRIETARGPYRNKMSGYSAFDTPAVWFSGRGDIDTVRDLLRDVPAIGAKGSSGYGAVSEIEVVETSQPHAGFAFSDGSPARPVPVDVWRDAGGGQATTALETWAPPYWKGERTICSIPDHHVVDRRDAKRLIGA